MSEKAYVLAWIDRESGQVERVGVYSEDANHITHCDHTVAVLLQEVEGDDFAEAYERGIESVKGPHNWHSWAAPFLERQ